MSIATLRGSRELRGVQARPFLLDDDRAVAAISSSVDSGDEMRQNEDMAEVRVRSLNDDVVEALEAAAKRLGRSLESHVRELLKEAARCGTGQFPLASEWIRAGFDEVHELIPGRQYLAWAALRVFRVTISQSLTGDDPEGNTEIEESARLDTDNQSGSTLVWSRATDVPRRLLGTTASAALRDAIRWIADYAGGDAVGQARAIAEITSK